MEITVEKDREFNKCSRTKPHNLLETNESHRVMLPFHSFYYCPHPWSTSLWFVKDQRPCFNFKVGDIKKTQNCQQSEKNGTAFLHLIFHLLLLFFLFPIKAAGSSNAFGLLPCIFSFCLFLSFLAHSGTGKQCGWQKGTFHHFIKIAFFLIEMSCGSSHYTY